MSLDLGYIVWDRLFMDILIVHNKNIDNWGICFVLSHAYIETPSIISNIVIEGQAQFMKVFFFFSLNIIFSL